MRFSHKLKLNRSKWLPFNNLITGMFIVLLVSLTINVVLLQQSMTMTDENIPEMDYRIGHLANDDCNGINKIAQTNNTETTVINTETDIDSNPCHFNRSLQNRIYIYDIPNEWREMPRALWYERFVGLHNYNDTRALNFGFGDKMFKKSNTAADNALHLTHMHVLEIIFNERLKSDKYYITDDPSQAVLFHIPFPFGLHYRFWERTESKRIASHHLQLQKWLNDNEIYQKYFVNSETRRPHMLTFGRIAYETHRLEKMGSQFFQTSADVTKYWMLSIDRNCHGDPPHCWKRVSLPHPSNFHPLSAKALKILITKLKKSFAEQKKTVLVSFCGYLRTKNRNISRDTCSHFLRKSKWRNAYKGTYDKICVFNDGLHIKREVGKHKLKVQHRFTRECHDLYEKSVFCISDGADSTTRKGLWDSLLLGCIPLFINGGMTDEFSCYGMREQPWFVVQQKEFFVNQLLSLPEQFIKVLQRNLLRLIPKIVYTNGNAGFSDAFDLIWHCLVRKTSFENKYFNPECTEDYLVKHSEELYDFDKQLGYDKLYEYLEI